MAENQQNKSSDFMIEKIKQRPVNKRKLLRRTVITVFMAVLFGLVACFTFLVLEPVFNKWLYPEEKPQVIIFPEESEEMKLEDMLTTEEEKKAEESENVTLEEEQIQEILSGVTLDKTNYKQLYVAMDQYVEEISRSMVTVTGIVSDVDWFSNSYETKGQEFGVIVADNGKELLILTTYTPIKRAGVIQITFPDMTQTQAQIKRYDSRVNLAVLAVSKEKISAQTQEKIKIAILGSSNINASQGTPVVALGSPMGVTGSVCYGMITTEAISQNIIDCNCKMLMTDIYASQEAKGVLFNLQGEVIGIIGIAKSTTDMKNIISALGISELKKVIAKMSNDDPIAYMGVYGVDVTDKAHEDLGVPYGAYINQVSIDSPAMMSGIQRGDVITEFDGVEIKNYDSYVEVLMRTPAEKEVQVKIMRQVQDDYKEMTFDITLSTVQ